MEAICLDCTCSSELKCTFLNYIFAYVSLLKHKPEPVALYVDATLLTAFLEEEHLLLEVKLSPPLLCDLAVE